MSLALYLGGALAVGYAGYKVLQRTGGASQLGIRMPRRHKPARKAIAPDRIAFERITLDATAANLLAFIRLTGTLERLGFRPFADFVVTAWPDQLHRALFHPGRPIYATIVQEGSDFPEVALVTAFEDGSTHTTRRSEPSDHRRPAMLRLLCLPEAGLDELYVQHMAALERLESQNVVPASAQPDAYFSLLRETLIADHMVREQKRSVRPESLGAALEGLPELPVADLLKRYVPISEVVETPADPPVQKPVEKPVQVPEAAAPRAPAPPAPEPPSPTPAAGGGLAALKSRLASSEPPADPKPDPAAEPLTPTSEAPRAPLPFEIITYPSE
jgi:hypothetical protein